MSELRVTGMGLRKRFVVSMTVALTLVMFVAAGLLYTGANRVQETIERDTVTEAVKVSYRKPNTNRVGQTVTKHESGVVIYPVTYGPNQSIHGTQYEYDGGDVTSETYKFLVPASAEEGGEALLTIIAIVMVLVILVGAAVAFFVSGQVTRPVHVLIDDVRQISHGHLNRRMHVSGGGEIELLARSIERMTRDLQSAQDAEFELSRREREMSIASDIREALLPMTTPMMRGYDVAAVHISSPTIGGDFHDYIEMEDGRVGLLVSDVSGQGMPAALIGATARSYLRTELQHIGAGLGTEVVAKAVRRVNHWLSRDLKRGVYVSALYALVDPRLGRATVACAGHKIPLLRYSADDGQLRTVHPEGIALGLDKGPVFDRALEVQEVPIEVGDRLFLCNSGPVKIVNRDGRELGEKAFYARVLKHQALESHTFLKALRSDLELYAGEDEIPQEISLVTISRES